MIDTRKTIVSTPFLLCGEITPLSIPVATVKVLTSEPASYGCEIVSLCMYMNNINVFTHIFAYLAQDPGILKYRTRSESAYGNAKVAEGRLLPPGSRLLPDLPEMQWLGNNSDLIRVSRNVYRHCSGASRLGLSFLVSENLIYLIQLSISLSK